MPVSRHIEASKKGSTKQKRRCRHTRGAIYAGAVTMVLALTLEVSSTGCQAKDFDWGELGVQLANAKPALSGQSASNLRILVSPQRRMSKNYEFEYTNSSQTQPSQSDANSYVISSSSGTNPYMGQSVYQLSPNHTIHSSAYSALSASLASLKSRLNARGVSLSSALGENGSQPTTSHLYSTQGAYGPSVLLDPNQQVQQQARQQVGQAPPQQGYLSVSSQQEQQNGAAYTVPPNQGSDNKTIVLAIPAKINFLTGAKQQSQQQAHTSQHQAQHLSVLQSGGEHQARPEYASKQQLGVLSPDANLEAPVEASNEQGEQHQYVIVNQPQMVTGDHHSHSVAANLSPSAVSSNTQVYSTILQAAPSSVAQLGGYAVKYVPAYTSQSGGQQPASIQKVYSLIEPQPLAGASIQQMQSALAQVQPSYEPQLIEQPALSGVRYLSCLDTCNSADPRWRKYTVSKYKACCSRSAQYDTAFEQPSAEKVGETSSRYSDDAYYNYLYRRSRARRSRRARLNRNHYGSSSSRNYYANSAASSASSGSPPSAQSDEEPQLQEPQTAENGAARAGPTSGRSAYYNSESAKAYRANRGAYGSGSTSSSIQDSAADSVGRDEPLSAKYTSAKERAHRRGRSRDLEPTGEPQALSENVDDEPVYQSSRSSASGYGNNDYSVDAQARYLAPEGSRGHLGGDEEEQARFEEAADVEPAKSDEYNSDGFDSSASEEGEIEGLSSSHAYKYPAGNRRKKSQLKSRRRPLTAAKGELPKYYKKSRKNNKYAKSSSGDHATSANSTDYESAQPGEYQVDQSSGFNSEQDDQSAYSNKSSQSPYEQSDSDKEAMLAKYRASLNETTVANLSKTTMHLKEILSILEKKAHLRSNETGGQQAPVAPQPTQAQQSLPVTSTPAPITTTTLYPPFSSLLSSSSAYSSPLSSDFLASDFGLKSPYRFEPSSLTSSLGSAPMSLPSSFGSFGSAEAFNPLAQPYPPQYGLHSSKHLGAPNGPQRKRRPSKNGRYNDIMFQKAAHSLMNQPSLLHAATKNRFLSPAYYSALQYPYLYRGAGPTITNPYPYKNIHKNPYSSLLNGPSKFAGSGQLYTDESRLHSLTGLDPLANMASSLRPSSTLRLRNKPFVFQPQVVPIYTRHSILSPSLDVKA